MSYVPLLGWIPLLVRPADENVRWHARNGLRLFGAVIGVALAATLVGVALPSLTLLSGLLLFFVGVVYAIVDLLAVVKALQGVRLVVPGVSPRGR